MADVREGGLFAGYRVVRRLGAGGMGQVWLVENPQLHRLEAMKVVAAGAGDDFARRFLAEARTVAGLDHPNIVTVYAYGIEDDAAWFTMTHLDGEDLARAGTLPPDDMTTIVAAVADALDYAHARGVIHRDIKPANIVVRRDEAGRIARVTVLDFGIAKLTDGTSLTATNAFVGTLTYAPPETITGAGVSAQSDQYSLAATAYQLLTGTAPFAGDNPGALMMAHLNGPIPRVSATVPATASVDRVIARGLAKDPSHRYSSTGEFGAALAAAVGGVSLPPRPNVPARPATPSPFSAHAPTVTPAGGGPTPTPTARGRGRLLVVAAIALVGVLVLGGIGHVAVNRLTGGASSGALPANPAAATGGMPTLRSMTSSGGGGYCAVTEATTGYCWGSIDVLDNRDQPSTEKTYVWQPTAVTQVNPIEALSLGWFGCAVSRGDLYCWGDADGDPATTSMSQDRAARTRVVKVPGLTGVTAVAANQFNVCAIASGAVYCWGRNQFGTVGDGTTTDRPTPTRVLGVVNPSSVVLADDTACAVASGEVWCWGANAAGQVGDGTTTARPTPAKVPGLGRVTSMSSSRNRTCAVSDGTVYCWGHGIGGLTTVGINPRPVAVSQLGSVSAVAVADTRGFVGDSPADSTGTVCAIQGDRVLCGGDNSTATLGDGTKDPRTGVIAVPGVTGARFIAAQHSSVCAATATQVLCWGDNSTGGLMGRDVFGHIQGYGPIPLTWPTK